MQLPLLHQYPRGRGREGLGARHDIEEGLIGCGLFDAALNSAAQRPHQADFAVARDRELARRKQSFLDFALRAIEERLYLVRIESDLFRAFSKEMCSRHFALPPS